MAEYTKNLNLEKPDYEEYYDIGTFNANADKIDKGIEDSEKRSTQRLEVHKDSNDHTADKIRYDGRIPKNNVKDALDTTDERIDNIVSQGGDDNTEVVDARHSTTKDKTYPVLKDRLEAIEKETNVVKTVTETSYDSVIPVPDSATNGQVSGVVRGHTITQELNYNPETLEEWTLLHGAIQLDNKIKLERTSEQIPLAALKTSLKPETKYGFLATLHENTGELVTSGNNAFGDSILNFRGTGNIKAIATTLDTISNNRLLLKMASNDTLAVFSNIRSFELPEGSEIEQDFETMSADELSVKYPFVNGTKSTIGAMRITAENEDKTEKSQAYITAKDKDNKIVNLKSLPNGVADEISLNEGKAIIKIGTKTNIASDTVINYTDMADGGQFVAYYEDGTQQVGIKGDTLTATATSLIYQLAEPEIIPIRWTGLQAYEGGTVYVDTVIPELGFVYNQGLESHYPDHPIKEVDTLYRVDKETGYREPLDVSKCIISEDRLSFTHPDLVDGDLCDWDYVPMTESTRPETSLTFPSNLKASVNSLLDGEERNKKEHNIFKARLDNHDGDISRVQSDIDTHKSDKNNPHNVTKSQVGLGNVVNEEQATKSEFDTHTNETPEDNVHGLSGVVIVESGSNENGDYVKFGDGTMICTRTVQLDRSSANTLQDFDFPQEYMQIPAVSVAHEAGTDQSYQKACASTVSMTNKTHWRIVCTVTTTVGTNNNVYLMAIGRWK